jgi:hypothetical protein
MSHAPECHCPRCNRDWYLVTLDEMAIPPDEWMERHFPNLADFECRRCGQIGAHAADCGRAYATV